MYTFFALIFFLLYYAFHLEANTKQQEHYWRAARSPDSERIQQWKLAFSGDLKPFPRILEPMVSCNWALQELCLKHVSCRELWALFRRMCLVDAQNNCLMTNKNDCWQSFEGISWTGLGACTCPGNNSDCHWIRLQTNYNKCIYELSHDTSWHAQLNGPGQFYANQGANNNGNGNATTTKETIRMDKQWRSEQQAKRQQWILQQQQNEEQQAQRTWEIVAQQEEERKHLKRIQDRKDEEERRRRRIKENKEKQIKQEGEMRIRKMKEEEEARIRRRKLQWEEDERRRKFIEEQLMRRNDESKTTKKIIITTPSPSPFLTNQHRKTNNNLAKEERTGLQQQQNITAASSAQHFLHQKLNLINATTLYYTTVAGPQNNLTTTTRMEALSKIRVQTTATTTIPITMSHHHQIKITPTQGQRLVTQAELPPTSKPLSLKFGTTTSTHNINTPQALGRSFADGINVNDTTTTTIGGPVTVGTCPEVLAVCERDDSACKWHLSELLIKCSSDERPACYRSAQCSASLSRFVRFVLAPLAEAMLFCSPTGQEMPMILRHHRTSNCSTATPKDRKEHNTKHKMRWTCLQTAQMCRAEPSCSRRLSLLRNSCPSHESDSGEPMCTAKSVGKCRSALMAIRGSWLDEPCHCVINSKNHTRECQKWERTLWPGNPCIYDAQADFNEHISAGHFRIEPSLPKVNSKHPAKPTIAATTPTITSAKQKQHSFDGAATMELGDEVSLLPAEDEENKNMNMTAVSKAKINHRIDTTQIKLKNGSALTANITKLAVKNNNRHNRTAQIRKEQRGRLSSFTAVNVDDKIVENASEKLIFTTKTQGMKQQDEKDVHQLTSLNRDNSSLLSYELANGFNKTNSTTDDDDDLRMELAPVPMQSAQARSTGRQPLPTDADFVTQRPPSQDDGCQTRNIDGEWVEHYRLSIFRQYHDWAGRCSSWCECLANGNSECHKLGCLSDVLCETRHTTIGFGQRLYLEDRGACQCHEGRFICDSSEFQRELLPGIYITLGYSKTELELIRKKVPKAVLERSGLISQSSSLVKDLATRLQFALERVLPVDTKCRIAVLEHFPPEQVVLMQLQWFGVDPSSNQTSAKWHSGKMEKYCSDYVRELEWKFLLEQADRYQLLLSTIKQIRVIDLLDALPSNAAHYCYTAGKILTINLLILQIIWLILAKPIYTSFLCALFVW